MSELYTLEELARLILAVLTEVPRVWTWGALAIELECDPDLLTRAINLLLDRAEIAPVSFSNPFCTWDDTGYINANLIPLFLTNQGRNN